jgi:hypothetical protein
MAVVLVGFGVMAGEAGRVTAADNLSRSEAALLGGRGFIFCRSIPIDALFDEAIAVISADHWIGRVVKPG